MTTEQTITIHHEPPVKEMESRTICAYNSKYGHWSVTTADYVRFEWGRTYTAWYDPQVGEPVKPRRYVVKDHRDRFYVWNLVLSLCVADLIPTRSAAEAIADIYERAAEGGEG